MRTSGSEWLLLLRAAIDLVIPFIVEVSLPSTTADFLVDTVDGRVAVDKGRLEVATFSSVLSGVYPRSLLVRTVSGSTLIVSNPDVPLFR